MMGVITSAELEELKAFDASLNQEQKDWVKHKCNWEQMTRYAVLRDYKGYIVSIANPTPKTGGKR